MQNNAGLIHGWLFVDKPTGMTSNQLLGKTKRIFGTKKGGFVGTLDPMASGVLPVALGEATKTIPFIQQEDKTYEAVIQFGTETDTDDAEGEILSSTMNLPSHADVIESILPQFRGLILQTPPRYSAKKIAGKRAYNLARAGKEVVLAPVPISVHTLLLHAYDPAVAQAVLTVTCSKGGYIRALARDIARALGSLGHLSALRRTQHGKISLDDVFSLDLMEEMVQKGAAATILQPLWAVLDGIPVLQQENASDIARLLHGNDIPITQKEDLALAQIHAKEHLLAIGRVSQQRFFPTRVFNIDIPNKG